MRSILRSVVAIFALSISFGASVRAADPIEFTFTGTYTQTTGTVHTVGSPFTTTVIYDPSVPDLNPNPGQGRYEYISWVAPSRFNTPHTFDENNGFVQVFAGVSSNDGWFVQAQGSSLFWSLELTFPPTWPNEALPTTLDFAQATRRDFLGSDPANGVQLNGILNSLTIRVLPEPSGITLLSFIAVFAPRWRRQIESKR